MTMDIRKPGDVVAHVIDARLRDIGAFVVRRLLPAAARRTVGPFIYLDHMGPVRFGPGEGMDVLPHPHIGLATVTYLFEGELLHRDSLGSEQVIRPGEVNWMTAGRGIVHSERTPPSSRASGSTLSGLQMWVALPAALEEAEPAFRHHAADTLPEVRLGDVLLRILVGEAYGVRSPAEAHSPLFYVDARMPAGSELHLPERYEERGIYLVEGALGFDGDRVEPGRMIVFERDVDVTLRAEVDTRLVLLGGEPLDGPRHIVWNFVSSSSERIDRAKQEWKQRRFPSVPGDEREFVPFPE